MKNDDTSPEQLRPPAARADDDLGDWPGAASGLGRHPLLVFTVLTFALSWLPLIPYLLGAFRRRCWHPARSWPRSSPQPWSEAGGACGHTSVADPVAGRPGLVRPCVPGPGGRLGDGRLRQRPARGGTTLPSPARRVDVDVTATLVFLINPFAGAWEEPGWRGYALPLLLRRHPALAGSAILGVIWTLWHLPLFLTGLIPWPDAAVVFALTFVFTAVYLRTAGSVLIAFLLHAAINGAGAFFVGLFSGDDRVRMYWIMAAVCAVVAIAAIVAGRDRWRRMPAIGDHDDATAVPDPYPERNH